MPRLNCYPFNIFRITVANTQPQVTLEKLLSLPNGKNAMEIHTQSDNNESGDNIQVYSFSQSGTNAHNSAYTRKRSRAKQRRVGFVDITKTHLSSENDSSDHQDGAKRRRLGQGRISLTINKNGPRSRPIKTKTTKYRSESSSSEAESQSDSSPRATRSKKVKSSATVAKRGIRSSTCKQTLKDLENDDPDVDELAGDGVESEGSAIVHIKRRVRNRHQLSRAFKSTSNNANRIGRMRRALSTDSSSSPEQPEPTRRSGRSRVAKSMKEQDINEEIYADDVPESSAPKAVSVREIFQSIPKHTRFGLAHRKDCDVCGGSRNNSNKGPSPLIYCQGCSSSIHKLCLGNRSNREHLITKIGHENFVLQCRRCIGIARKRDATAPRLDLCTSCNKPGVACAAFSQKKTPKQEEKLREDNGGEDPITEVREELINNDANVLFRCRVCDRGWHLEHLPAQFDNFTTPIDLAELRYKRLNEYSPKWQCRECDNALAKVKGLTAWRPIYRKSYVTGTPANQVSEDDKEYLVRWENRSYFQCSWMPGAWVWGMTASTMRKAFLNRDGGVNMLPKWTVKEAIPEEWLRFDIVLDVKYSDEYTPYSMASDKAHIDDIDQVLIKFQGLGYDEVVWEKPPSPDEPERWSHFVAAFSEYLVGIYFKQQPLQAVKKRITGFRSANFERKIELRKQPSCLTGGEIMPYQMEGLNWLLYNFHRQKNVILADEMGLGKTIQIIALLASLIKDNPKV